MNEAYHNLGIDSRPEVKLKIGANTDLSQSSYSELGRMMNEKRIELERELESVKIIEDFV